MSTALSCNVILALSTAGCQLTLGFVRSPLSTATCIGFAGASLALVIYLTVQLTLAHREWFKKIEKDKKNLH